jgi:hypothetical protein
MIEAKRRFIREEDNGSNDDDNDNDNTGSSSIIIINPATRAHFHLEIQTLQNAPRDASKLEQIIKAKERVNDKARHIEDTQRLVTEIEMLKVVFYLGISRIGKKIIITHACMQSPSAVISSAHTEAPHCHLSTYMILVMVYAN